jgi:hypothetical protein
MARPGRAFAPGLITPVPLDQNPQGGIGLERNLARNVVGRSAADTLAAATLTGIDDYCPVDASGGAVIVTLPHANTPGTTESNTGAEYVILKTDSSVNAVTITPATWSVGIDRINGSTASLVIKQQYAGYRLVMRAGGTSAVSNGDWQAFPLIPGAVDPIAVRRISTPLTAYGATDSAVVIPAADGAAGWGATATFAVETAAPPSNDLRGKVSVSALGTPGANPTVTVTYKDGAFAVAPIPLLTRAGVGAFDWCVTGNTTTGFIATIIGTPSSGVTYRFFWKLEL